MCSIFIARLFLLSLPVTLVTIQALDSLEVYFICKLHQKFPAKKKKSTYAEGLNEISYTYLCCQLSKQLCSFYPGSRLPKKEFHRYSKIYTRSHVIWRIRSHFTAKWLVLYKLPKIKCLCYSKFILGYQVFDNLLKIHLRKSPGLWIDIPICYMYE